MRTTDLLTTADASKVLGVVPDTVRQWARRGLVPSLPTPSGQRLYRRGDIERLARDRAARQEAARDA